MKSYDKKISTKFHGSVIPKEEGTPCVFFISNIYKQRFQYE